MEKEGKNELERDKGMYAIQRKIGMCEVVIDKAMADRLQTWMTNVRLKEKQGKTCMTQMGYDGFLL